MTVPHMLASVVVAFLVLGGCSAAPPVEPLEGVVATFPVPAGYRDLGTETHQAECSWLTFSCSDSSYATRSLVAPNGTSFDDVCPAAEQALNEWDDVSSIEPYEGTDASECQWKAASGSATVTVHTLDNTIVVRAADG
jgi:hypothetical protein